MSNKVFVSITVCLMVVWFILSGSTLVYVNKTDWGKVNTVSAETEQTEPEIITSDTVVVVEEPDIIPETEPPCVEPTEPDVWAERHAEYPVATEVWLMMKSFGWSDIVCAGIMGNLMRETGGDTLHLKPDAVSNSGFGLVQWTGERYKDMCSKYGQSPTVAEQMEFMKDELYGTNGVVKQVTDSQGARIFEADTPEKCAGEFAVWFERPAYNDYSRRKANAEIAYYYFQ